MTHRSAGLICWLMLATPSLAQDLRERPICIILSGTGSDGSLCLREIKAECGLTMVQSMGTCEFDGMPGDLYTSR